MKFACLLQGDPVTDENIKCILENSRTVAVVGISKMELTRGDDGGEKPRHHPEQEYHDQGSHHAK